VEERVVGQADRDRVVRAVDLETPGQVGRQAEQLLVEPVAETAEGLCEQQARREGVGERPEPDPGHPAADPDTERAADEGAEDRHAALPDVERLEQVRTGEEVVVRVGQHMVDTPADDAEGHREEGDVEGDPRLRAAGGEPVVRQDHRDDDARQDAQGVGVDVDVEAEPGEADVAQPLSEVEDLPLVARARDAQGVDHGGGTFPGWRTRISLAARSAGVRRRGG